jgi:cytochrome c oxidase subunit 1
MFGRMLNKNLGYIHFGLLLYVLMGVFPMHFIGLAGLPRRYYTNTNFPLFDDLQNVNVDNYFRTDRWGISINIFI